MPAGRQQRFESCPLEYTPWKSRRHKKRLSPREGLCSRISFLGVKPIPRLGDATVPSNLALVCATLATFATVTTARAFGQGPAATAPRAFAARHAPDPMATSADDAPLDSNTATLTCPPSDKAAPALCAYAQLFRQHLLDCGLVPKGNGWLRGRAKPIPLPAKICAHYREDRGCVLDPEPASYDDLSKPTGVSLRAIFAAAMSDNSGIPGLSNALQKPALPPLPVPTFAVDNLLDTDATFLLDRRNCAVSKSGALAAGFGPANGKADTSATEDAVLTIADGWMRSPLALEESDPGSHNAFSWRMVDWYLELPEYDRNRNYYFASAVDVPTVELEIHSQNASDLAANASGGFGLGVFTLTAFGSVQDTRQEIVHIHEYAVPNRRKAIHDLQISLLPTLTSLQGQLAPSLQEVRPPSYDAARGAVEGVYLAEGMPASLCVPQVWSAGSDDASAATTYRAPGLATALGGCQFDIAVPAAFAHTLAVKRDPWKLSLRYPADSEPTLTMAIPGAASDFAAFDVQLGATGTQDEYSVQGAGAGGIDVRWPPMVTSTGPDGCT